jgi:hypothetical protein
VHNVSPGAGSAEPDPEAPRTRICRHCATEVLLWGLKDWWIRERQRGFVEEEIMKREDCPEGERCGSQHVLGSSTALLRPLLPHLLTLFYYLQPTLSNVSAHACILIFGIILTYTYFPDNHLVGAVPIMQPPNPLEEAPRIG